MARLDSKVTVFKFFTAWLIAGVSIALSSMVLFPAFALAHVDYGVTALFRSYSPGLSVNPTVGYSQLLWGDPASPWYGFVRPYAIGVVSPSVYEGKIGLEVFPVSILGIDVRRAYGRRFLDTKNQNCEVLECQGALSYTDLSLQSFLGNSDFFASIRFTRTFFDGDESRSFPVYELGSSILLSPNGDRGDYLSLAAGRNFIGFLKGLSWGILHQRNDFRELQQSLTATYLFLSLDMRSGASIGQPGPPQDSDRLTFGMGTFQSSRNVSEFSVVASYVYSPRAALGYGR